jgi:hypothetical protein
MIIRKCRSGVVEMDQEVQVRVEHLVQMDHQEVQVWRNIWCKMDHQEVQDSGNITLAVQMDHQEAGPGGGNGSSGSAGQAEHLANGSSGSSGANVDQEAQVRAEHLASLDQEAVRCPGGTSIQQNGSNQTHMVAGSAGAYDPWKHQTRKRSKCAGSGESDPWKLGSMEHPTAGAMDHQEVQIKRNIQRMETSDPMVKDPGSVEQVEHLIQWCMDQAEVLVHQVFLRSGTSGSSGENGQVIIRCFWVKWNIQMWCNGSSGSSGVSGQVEHLDQVEHLGQWKCWFRCFWIK